MEPKVHVRKGKRKHNTEKKKGEEKRRKEKRKTHSAKAPKVIASTSPKWDASIPLRSLMASRICASPARSIPQSVWWMMASSSSPMKASRKRMSFKAWRALPPMFLWTRASVF